MEGKYHEQTIVVLGFLGGVAFTALVLVLQEKGTIESEKLVWIFDASAYFAFLTFWLAFVSALFIIATFATQRIVAGWVERGTWSEYFAYYLYLAGFFGFLAALPMILLPFTPYSAFMVFILGCIIGIIVILLPKRRKEKPLRPLESKSGERARWLMMIQNVKAVGFKLNFS